LRTAPQRPARETVALAGRSAGLNDYASVVLGLQF
jgi:hypothetical protein